MTPWEVVAKTLGPKISEDPVFADRAARLRLAWVLLNGLTCLTILAGNALNFYRYFTGT